MNLKEVAARLVFEHVLPPIRVVEIENPSFDQGKQLESGGKWKDALSHFCSLAAKTENLQERGSCYIEAAQMCVNYGRFGQARKFLAIGNEIAASLNGDDGLYLQARVLEKGAWIDDYEGRFTDSLRDLANSRQLLAQIPSDNWGQNEQTLASTLDHFSARAHVGLAMNREKPAENLLAARSYIDRELQKNLPPDNRGFQFAWLVRIALLEGNIDEAERYLREVKVLWRDKERGILAHYHLLKGGIAMAKGDYQPALQDFEEALRIREEVEEYPKGKADALIGIASAYWAKGHVGAAVVYAGLAIREYPLIVIRHSF
ncbi:MAG: hypothetical protein G01um101416_99 [Microgenomates group bacterium Gr01-1014_16]|nr:MAG: hypothetical protein G01um101416_99 [Microgenomates group bacterium Gr01-1014_16]